MRCGDVAAREVDDRPRALQFQDHGLAEIAPALVDLGDQLGKDVGVTTQPLERPAERRRRGLMSRAEQGQQLVGDVLSNIAVPSS